MRRSLLALSLVVLVAGVVVSLAAGGSGSGSAGRWVIRDLTPGVSVYSSVVAINERGQVLVDVDVGGRIFVWSAGRSRDVRGLSFPSDINERGQVTGRVRAGGDLHAALWDSGRIRDLGTLGGKDSAAVALNDRAQVIGESETRIEDADGYVIERAFLWEEGKMRDLGVLDSVATAINERGQVVGRTLGGRGWSWQNGRMVVLKASPRLG